MKRLRMFPLLVVAGSVLIMAPLSRDQSLRQELDTAVHQFFDPQPQNETAYMDQLRSFDDFLQDDPDLGRALRQRPELLNDQEFVDNQPALRGWLATHPEAADAFRQNPDQFMEREQRFEEYRGDLYSGDERRSELAEFDWFLDCHPGIRRDLMARPHLAQSERYLEEHSDLSLFLDQHTIVRHELTSDPRGLMDREAGLEAQQPYSNEERNDNGAY